MAVKPRENFHARLSEDRLRIEVTFSVPASRVEEEIARVRTELIELGLPKGPEMEEAEERLREVLTAQLEAAQDPLEVDGLLLLEGKAAEQPEDARIVWGGEFLKEGFVVDPETDAVDYRRRAANPSVEEGQFLAELIPPKPGKPGVDVFGKRIDPRKPKSLRIRVGKNVRADSMANKYYAEKAGRVRFIKDQLSVDDLLEIKGSVGLKTGHIDHPGAVMVGIDIESDSEVRSAGDIEVRGGVEESYVESGGNVLVKGGIVGKKHCKVVAAGNVEASFVHHCTIEAGGDVIVSQEINLCTIHARGVICVKGRIVGGSAHAIKGIDVGQIGTDAGVRTELAVGKDWVVEAEISEKKAAIEAANENLKKINAAIAPLQKRIPTLQGDAKAQAMELLKKAKSMSAAVEEARGELEELFEKFRQGWNKMIIIRNILNPDAILHVGPQTIKVGNVVQGPRKVVLRGSKIRFQPLGDKDTLEDTGEGDEEAPDSEEE